MKVIEEKKTLHLRPLLFVDGYKNKSAVRVKLVCDQGLLWNLRPGSAFLEWIDIIGAEASLAEIKTEITRYLSIH